MLNSTPPVANGPLNAIAPPGPASADAGDNQAFAQALDQAAARQRDTAAEAAQAADRDDSRPDTDASGPARPDPVETRPAQGNRGRAARPPAVAEPVAEAAAEATGALADDTVPLSASSDDSRAPATSSDTDQPPPDLAAWVSSLVLPRPAPATTATPAAAGTQTPQRVSAPAQAADDMAVAAASRAAQAPDLPAPQAASAAPAPGFASALAASAARPADARNARAAQTAAVDPAAQARQAAADPSATTLPVLAVAREGSTLPRTTDQPSATLPAALAGWPAALSPATADAMPAQAEVKAPVGTHEFAPALGSMLSVMVRDGIDHAQLKLNPAEMGPIEVRISLDGSMAQVDFSAAHAATRQALQDAVPALASALRETGLTLTGGGVFEQAREQRGDARQDGARQPAGSSRAPLDGGAAPLSAARLPRARGVVDLYA